MSPLLSFNFGASTLCKLPFPVSTSSSFNMSPFLSQAPLYWHFASNEPTKPIKDFGALLGNGLTLTFAPVDTTAKPSKCCRKTSLNGLICNAPLPVGNRRFLSCVITYIPTPFTVSLRAVRFCALSNACLSILWSIL